MPKKIGEKTLTRAEVMARYRAKKKAAGFKEKARWINPEEEARRLEEEAREKKAEEEAAAKKIAEKIAAERKKIERAEKAEIQRRALDQIEHLIRVMRNDGRGGIPNREKIPSPPRPALTEAVKYIREEYIPQWLPELNNR